MLKTYLMLTCAVVLIGCKRYDTRKDGKLLLNPVQLVDLIAQERLMKSGSQVTPLQKQILLDEPEHDVLDLEEQITTEQQECEDEETLMSRKVWSRWSKWGECSVTCGVGAISRQRACVAGRCARGEREEQRRPCARAPCDTRPADDARDAD